jgi:multidrug efflux system membrane fusion protein
LPSEVASAQETHPRRFRWGWWLLVLLLLLAGGAWWISQQRAAGAEQKSAAAAKTRANAPVLVTLTEVRQEDVPVVLQLTGTVTSLNSVEVRPQVSNLVRQVHVKEGQFVKAGQLLFTLDDRVDRANLQKAQAQLQRDSAGQSDLDRQVKRSQELVAQNFIAKSAVDTTLSQRDAQKAAVAADQAAIRAAQVAVDLATLRAPVAGRIGAVQVYPGSLVTPAAGVVTVTQLDPIAVSFPVPEEHLQDLLAAARAHLAVTASPGGGREDLTGTLDFVDNAVDPQIGTVRAKAVFANPRQALWPGQFVQAHVTVRTLQGAAVIPAAAVLTLADESAVFVVDTTQKKAARRPVQVLHTFGTQVAVTGVKPGQKVALEGKQNLHDGSLVRENTPKETQGNAPSDAAPVAPGTAVPATPRQSP